MMNQPPNPAMPTMGAAPTMGGTPAAMGQRPPSPPRMGGQPGGNGWGQQFMQQYGKPPGQMRDQWNAFRQQNGMGGGQMGGGNPAFAPAREAMQTWRQARPQPSPDYRSQMDSWRQQRPDMRSLISSMLMKD